MKYHPHFLLAAAAAFLTSSCAAPGGGGTASSGMQLGPHSAQKFALATRIGGAHQIEAPDPNTPQTLALVVTVEQKMNGNEQEIIARAAAHKDGPNGALVSVDGLRVHVLQPTDFGTEPHKTGEARITKTISAPGGKYKTVVAEASIHSPSYIDTVVSLTIPGDQP
jgi:hypothetical protein